MAGKKGLREYRKFKEGESLTRGEAILAQCYVCNGMDEGGEDCKDKSCPLYQFMPYREGRIKKVLSEGYRQKLMDSLRRGREVKKNDSISVGL